jgi:ADP-ribosylglycohydrolase
MRDGGGAQGEGERGYQGGRSGAGNNGNYGCMRVAPLVFFFKTGGHKKEGKALAYASEVEIHVT